MISTPKCAKNITMLYVHFYLLFAHLFVAMYHNFIFFECLNKTKVALNQWIVLFTKRDQQKAIDFIQTMKQCCPQMGIQVFMFIIYQHFSLILY